MRSGQRDLNNRTPKRRLSIGYEELEAIHESIRVSVLNELRAALGNNPGQGPAGAEQKLKELKVLHDGLLRELLDQKTVVMKLEAQVRKLSEKLEKLESKAPAVSASFSTSTPPPLFDDPLDLPPISRRPKQRVDIKKKVPLARERIEVREVPAPLPGTSTKLELRVEDEFPEDAAAEDAAAARCEYIIAESGELKARPASKKKQEQADKHECEYIIAERPVRKTNKDETVVQRDEEDVEIITCSR